MNTDLASKSAYQNRERSLGSLTQQIVGELGADVVIGKYSGDNAFPIESEICEKYSASRSIVREAVKVLNAKGLLIARPRRGTSVRPETDWNLLDPDVLNWILKRRFSLPLLIDFTRARLAIEPAAAAEAGRTATRDQKQAIREAVEAMEDASRGQSNPLETDVDFHLAVLQASNNRFFYHMSPLIETALRLSVRFTGKRSERAWASVHDHRNIAESILAGDQDGAARASRKMLERALGLMGAG